QLSVGRQLQHHRLTGEPPRQCHHEPDHRCPVTVNHVVVVAASQQMRTGDQEETIPCPPSQARAAEPPHADAVYRLTSRTTRPPATPRYRPAPPRGRGRGARPLAPRAPPPVRMPPRRRRQTPVRCAGTKPLLLALRRCPSWSELTRAAREATC